MRDLGIRELEIVREFNPSQESIEKEFGSSTALLKRENGGVPFVLSGLKSTYFFLEGQKNGGALLQNLSEIYKRCSFFFSKNDHTNSNDHSITTMIILTVSLGERTKKWITALQVANTQFNCKCIHNFEIRRQGVLVSRLEREPD
jgi:hypothetical protein